MNNRGQYTDFANIIRTSVLTLVTLLFLTSCASIAGKSYIEPASLNNENSAYIAIYRTKVAYHSLNPEKPFFYLDGLFLGKIGTGQYIIIRVNSGEHVLTSRESFMFFPASESGRVAGNFEAGKKYYLRYSKDLTSMFPVSSSSFYMSDRTSLMPASEEWFNKKK